MSEKDEYKKLQRLIKATAEETVKTLLKKLSGDTKQKDMYHETKKILYAYPNLKLKCLMDQQDKENDTLIYSRGRSKDTVRIPQGCSRLTGDIEEELRNSRLASMERTRKEVDVIEKALAMVKSDRYYEILEYHFFGIVVLGEGDDREHVFFTDWIRDNGSELCEVQRLDDADIAVQLDKDERTIRRNKNKLINQLSSIFFGTSVLGKG